MRERPTMKRILIAAGVTVSVLVGLAGPAAAAESPLDDPSSPVHWEGDHDPNEDPKQREAEGNDHDGDGHPDILVVDACASDVDGGAATGPALTDACAKARVENPQGAGFTGSDVAGKIHEAEACAKNGADQVCGWVTDEGAIEVSVTGSPGVCAEYRAWDGNVYRGCANDDPCAFHVGGTGACLRP